MKKLFLTIMAFMPMITWAEINEKTPIDEVVEFGLKRATSQALITAKELKDREGRVPKTLDKGKLVTTNYADWISGFFPGTLWLLYENYPNDQQLLEYAKLYTSRVEEAKNVTSHHDVGFMINCSFGNGYRLTQDSHYKDVMITAAHSLATRFNDKIGCIQSWGARKNLWQFPVIIDNMMNLELLAEVSKMTGEERLMTIARRHAETTRKNHFRPDYSTYHVVSYDTLTFQPHVKQTNQGYSDPSAWARGQAWALYGYTMMFRETGDSVYLNQARKVANFLASHPRLPEDGVPYWDFDDDGIPNVCRDASAGAIYASGYIELSQYVPAEESKRWLAMAEKIIRSLTSPAYLAEEGEQHGFILKHSVGNMPKHSEVDVPLTYADYYYVEALLRLKHLRQSQGQRDRQLWENTLWKIASPVLENMANGTLHKNMPFEVLKNDSTRIVVSHLEAFGRTLAGIAPWIESNNDSLAVKACKLAQKGLANAVNTKCNDCLCFFHPKNKQPLVDAAYLAKALLTAPNKLWKEMKKKDQSNIIAALESTRQIKPNNTNWLLFASTIEAALLEFTGKCDEERLMDGIRKFNEEWYKGDGIYGDGMEFHYDYYNSIVIHPLLVGCMNVAAKHNLVTESEYQKAKKRMSRYAQILERLISPEGTYPVTGRSICYRTGHMYALSQAALEHNLPKQLKPGQVRSALTAVITRMMGNPANYDKEGWLRIGYNGSQINMAEKYINTGSLYMAAAGFVALGLPADDAFWTDPYMDWSSKKAWDGVDIGADHALRDLKK